MSFHPWGSFSIKIVLTPSAVTARVASGRAGGTGAMTTWQQGWDKERRQGNGSDGHHPSCLLGSLGRRCLDP